MILQRSGFHATPLDVHLFVLIGSSDHHLGESKKRKLLCWLIKPCGCAEQVMVLMCCRRGRYGNSLLDVMTLLWLFNSCSSFSLMASPLAPPSRVPAPLYVPIWCQFIGVCLAYKSFKNDEPLKMWFLPVRDRVPCTMTCTAANALPPRRTCWSVFSSVVMRLLPLTLWQCRQTNLCGLLCSL